MAWMEEVVGETERVVMYKVVDKNMKSCWTSPQSKYCVQYTIGEWIEAPIGGFFVYNHLSPLKALLQDLSYRGFRIAVDGFIDIYRSFLLQTIEPIDLTNFDPLENETKRYEAYWRIQDDLEAGRIELEDAYRIRNAEYCYRAVKYGISRTTEVYTRIKLIEEV